MIIFKKNALPGQAVWLGYDRGNFVIPSVWLNRKNELISHSNELMECGVRPYPPEWEGYDFNLAISVKEGFCKTPIYLVRFNIDQKADEFSAFLPKGYTSIGLREAVSISSKSIYAVLSRASQLLRWEEQHRFCSTCAGPLKHVNNDEFSRKCTACDLSFYPTLSPCVLVLVVREIAHQEPQLLLANGVRHTKDLWSVLAGFIEPGETVENALKREVQEEVGISVYDLTYRGSQSWPFPHALMLGFWAKTSDQELSLDPEEIRSANWFTASELKEAQASELLRLPLKGSLSRELIDDYLSLNR